MTRMPFSVFIPLLAHAAHLPVRTRRVITGVAITKINRIIQFKITERKLLPNGKINAVHNDSAWHQWRTAKEFSIDDTDVEVGIDYYALAWPHNRTIDLDTVFDADRVVTGVRFRVVQSHLRLQVRVTHFDFRTGQLADVQDSEWIGGDARERAPLDLKQPDRSTRTPQKSMPVRGENLSIQFQPTDVLKDAAQSTGMAGAVCVERRRALILTPQLAQSASHNGNFIRIYCSAISGYNGRGIADTAVWARPILQDAIRLRRFHCTQTDRIRCVIVHVANK